MSLTPRRNVPGLFLILSLCVLVATISPARADETDTKSQTDQSVTNRVKDAVSPDIDTAASSIVYLRAQGPSGLEALLKAYASDLEKYPGLRVSTKPSHSAVDAEQRAYLDRLRFAVNGVAGQYDAAASGLFWYTDWNAAAAESRRTKKPILTLRMLGKLTDDRSCANSRFFRTVLYADAQLSQYLRDSFVLHWESVRPVPRITIDYGDGRVIERTITGNSIHYVTTPDGGVIDAIPGVYSAKAFRQRIEAAWLASFFMTSRHSNNLTSHHRAALEDLGRRFRGDLAAAGVEFSMVADPAASAPVVGVVSVPIAIAAARVASGKKRVEAPMIRAIDSTPLPPDVADPAWDKIARLHRDESRLDEASTRLISLKVTGDADAAMRIASSKARIESPLLNMLSNFQASVARDTVYNEYRFRREILEWMIASPALAQNIATLNNRVYAQLFLMPLSDPWLGLAPRDVYAALDDQGLTQGKPAAASVTP